MTEAQALGLLLVVLLFVAYGVWDLSHHRWFGKAANPMRAAGWGRWRPPSGSARW